MTDAPRLTEALPYRMALAGGWIDQPFVSQVNPNPPGSMVVVSLQPNLRYMDRCGMATSTRKVALKLWGEKLPEGEPDARVRELYAAENADRAEPSGSQDMIGLVYPGISRLDYDAAHAGGYFPRHIERCVDAETAAWLEGVIHLAPLNQRPEGYNPLGIKRLDAAWISRLGESGRACYAAIMGRDVRRLGESFNECMRCWEAILPQTVRHPALAVKLDEILGYYQAHYAGAMTSGCGGGYVFVASEAPVAGTFTVKIRLA